MTGNINKQIVNYVVYTMIQQLYSLTLVEF